MQRTKIQVMGAIVAVIAMVVMAAGFGTELASAEDSGVTITTNFTQNQTFKGTTNLETTVSIANTSALKKGDSIVISLPTSGAINLARIQTNGGTSTGTFNTDSANGTVTYTLNADASLLSANMNFIINVPTNNVTTSNNVISAKTVTSAGAASEQSVTPSTFNTEHVDNGGSGYGGRRLILGIGLYGKEGAGTDNFIDGTAGVFIPNQRSMAANIVLDPGNYIESGKDTQRVITLCVSGDQASIGADDLFLKPSGATPEVYQKLTDVKGYSVKINGSCAVITIADDVNMYWAILGFHIQAPNIDGTYSYSAQYTSTAVQPQEQQLVNFVYQKTGNVGFIPQLFVDPKSVQVYSSDAVTDGALKNGVTASDVEDGDLTSKVVVSDKGGFDISKQGTYTVTYTVTDSSGNVVTATRTYTVVKDQTAVVSKDLSRAVGDAWSAQDSFVSAVDADGKAVELSGVTVDGKPDMSRPGVYEVKYSLKNHGGVEVSSTAKITVSDVAPTMTTKDATVYTSDPVLDLKSLASAKDASGNVLAVSVADKGGFDQSKPGEYTVQFTAVNQFGTHVEGSAHVTVVKDQTAVVSKDLSLVVGDAWSAQDSFVSAVDAD
ncbi:immunoglobulin-like domain-containing protein, partial [Bifidobacterium crudilactis]